ncbi:MAG: hypothetical protein ACJAY4_001529 [Cryomorphaceae bacterium]|jgi:hypothetical protein
MLFLPILTIAQDIVADKYYFILERDTIEGFYSDFEIENGKFEQYKIIQSTYDYPKAHLVDRLPNHREFELVWKKLMSGEHKASEPSGEWFQDGGMFWKRTTYLENDSIQLDYQNYQIVMTLDSSYTKGVSYDGYSWPTEWECIDGNCKIWLKSGSDTFECSFIEVLIHLYIGRQSSLRFKRTEN